MPLTTQQIQQILTTAQTLGLDADEIAALEWLLLDRAAQLDGANRLDLALQLGDDNEVQAAEDFMGELQRQRGEAIARGTADLNTMSDDEWESLINA